MSKTKSNTCSFCGREEHEYELLFRSNNKATICNLCIDYASNLVDDTPQEIGKAVENLDNFGQLKLQTPRQLKAHMDQYVIGQDEAKKHLAVAVYNHFKRLAQTQTNDEVIIQKSNIVLVGQTGTGKTYLAQTIAKTLHVPFCIVDATVFTEAGYVGEDVESILTRLLQAADYDVKAAERGIVYIDEIDKITRRSDNPSITRDVGGEGVQQSLLKLLEGSIVHVPPQGGRKHPEQRMIEVNTENILFICGGAFDTIERHISKRLNRRPIGFINTKEGMLIDQLEDKELLRYITAQDLKSFGLIPELVGRLPVVTYLEPLTKNSLLQILRDPKNALTKQYSKLLEMEGVKLIWTEEALDYIVIQAFDYDLGARGLRSICEAIMTDAMFELPSTKNVTSFEVTLDYAKEKFEKNNLLNLKSISYA